MKNALYTVFPAINFLSPVLSFANNVVIYENPAGPEANDILIGFNKEHAIENVTLDEVVIHGHKVTSTHSGMISPGLLKILFINKISIRNS